MRRHDVEREGLPYLLDVVRHMAKYGPDTMRARAAAILDALKRTGQIEMIENIRTEMYRQRDETVA